MKICQICNDGKTLKRRALKREESWRVKEKNKIHQRGVRLISKAYQTSQDSQHTALFVAVFSYHGMNIYTTHLLCSQQAQTHGVRVPDGESWLCF